MSGEGDRNHPKTIAIVESAEEGLKGLLTEGKSTGRTSKIPAEVEEKLKKELQEIEERLTQEKEKVKNYNKLRYWCEEESRLGLITLWARKLTAKGVQPVGIEQWCFDYLWLYGLVEPQTGDSFFAEFSHVDGVCFEQYLKWFAQKYPEELHIIQLDNGRLHTGLSLEIPENVILLFQPPYSPQVNPIERLWCID